METPKQLRLLPKLFAVLLLKATITYVEEFTWYLTIESSPLLWKSWKLLWELLGEKDKTTDPALNPEFYISDDFPKCDTIISVA